MTLQMKIEFIGWLLVATSALGCIVGILYGMIASAVQVYSPDVESIIVGLTVCTGIIGIVTEFSLCIVGEILRDPRKDQREDLTYKNLSESP